MKPERATIVKSGTWMYGGTVPHEVWIVRQNFEYWYEEEFDASERLNEHGEVFAVVYARDGNVIGNGPEAFEIAEAVAAAEKALPQGITWDDRRLQPLFGGRRYLLEEV